MCVPMCQCANGSITPRGDLRGMHGSPLDRAEHRTTSALGGRAGLPQEAIFNMLEHVSLGAQHGHLVLLRLSHALDIGDFASRGVGKIQPPVVNFIVVRACGRLRASTRVAPFYLPLAQGWRQG